MIVKNEVYYEREILRLRNKIYFKRQYFYVQIEKMEKKFKNKIDSLIRKCKKINKNFKI